MDIPRKLAPRFISPFPINRIIDPSTVRLKLLTCMVIRHTFYVSQINSVSLSPLWSPTDLPLPPWLIKDHLEHTIHHILDVCHRGHSFQCLVNWEGCGPEERSWIPRFLILIQALCPLFMGPTLRNVLDCQEAILERGSTVGIVVFFPSSAAFWVAGWCQQAAAESNLVDQSAPGYKRLLVCSSHYWNI